jgi:iron-sulfur cluster assembly protein
MLSLTPNATTVIRSLITGAQLPDSGGLRIASTQDGQQAFTVSTAGSPEVGDQVVEDGGARVFVETEAASALGETILDATVDPDGNVQFLLTAQARDGAG